MPDGMNLGMLTPEEFERIEDHNTKTNVLYRLVYDLYRCKKRETIYDGAKTIFGGFLGAITFMFAKSIFWK